METDEGTTLSGLKNTSRKRELKVHRVNRLSLVLFRPKRRSKQSSEDKVCGHSASRHTY